MNITQKENKLENTGEEESGGFDQKSSPPYLHLLRRISAPSFLPPSTKKAKKRYNLDVINVSVPAAAFHLENVQHSNKKKKMGKCVAGLCDDAPAPPCSSRKETDYSSATDDGRREAGKDGWWIPGWSQRGFCTTATAVAAAGSGLARFGFGGVFLGLLQQ